MWLRLGLRGHILQSGKDLSSSVKTAFEWLLAVFIPFMHGLLAVRVGSTALVCWFSVVGQLASL